MLRLLLLAAFAVFLLSPSAAAQAPREHNCGGSVGGREVYVRVDDAYGDLDVTASFTYQGTFYTTFTAALPTAGLAPGVYLVRAVSEGTGGDAASVARVTVTR